MSLKEARMRKGYTQLGLADSLDVAQTTISGWESGRNNIPYDMVEILSQVLSVPPSEITTPEKKTDTINYTAKETQLINSIRKFSEKDQLNFTSILTLFIENISLESNEFSDYLISEFISILSCMNDMLVRAKNISDPIEDSYANLTYQKYAELLKELAEGYDELLQERNCL